VRRESTSADPAIPSAHASEAYATQKEQTQKNKVNRILTWGLTCNRPFALCTEGESDRIYAVAAEPRRRVVRNRLGGEKKWAVPKKYNLRSRLQAERPVSTRWRDLMRSSSRPCANEAAAERS